MIAVRAQDCKVVWDHTLNLLASSGNQTVEMAEEGLRKLLDDNNERLADFLRTKGVYQHLGMEVELVYRALRTWARALCRQ